MRDIKNVCLIDPMQQLMVTAFSELGCKVLQLRTGDAPFFDLPAALEREGFVADLVVQTETLGNRSVVVGLDGVDCPTIFWAVDPHLNAHWQAAHARLFDVTCSTQRAWIPRLQSEGAEDVRWLPWYGRLEDSPDGRQYDMAFVGRLSSQRPVRKWMVEFLRQKADGPSLAVEDSLSYVEMIDLYRHSRIIPNESIFGEVNFRLFEAASCGCLVLGQDIAEQADLFEHGREMDTYGHVLEMDEKLDRYLGNERLTRTMGKAARARVHADHLPVNRAETLLEIGRDAALRRARGVDAAIWTGLTVAAMWEAGLLPLSVEEVLARLDGLERSGPVLAAVLRVQAAAGLFRPLSANVRAILGEERLAGSAELNLAGAMASLHLDEFDAARAYWYRHVRAAGLRPNRVPHDPAGLLTLWAKELSGQGRVMRAGFAFDPKRNLPTTGAECLMRLLEDEAEDLPTLRLLETMLRPILGMEQPRMGYLSVLTLHERRDWRSVMELGLVNLRSFRMASGLEELDLARWLAREQGNERMFLKALATRDPSGLLVKQVGC